MKNILVILLTLLAYSCSKDINQPNYPNGLKVNQNIVLDYGKCLKTIDKEYEICFTSISDSRCPVNAICVWEGDAAVEFNLKSNTESHSFTLHSNEKFQQDTVINNLKIKLLNVSLNPDLNNPTNLGSYTVELNISE
ncbi:MAG TPA: hypothetical protein VLZ75_11745 [Chitinophagales bacterium]|nr:hypothetical protein [Chitinophagales bacterium]